MKRALIVGVGGLGCPAALVLAEAGVALTLADPDRVELHNLHRQPLHREVGRLKAESAAEALRGQALPARVDAHNAAVLFREHDLVLDCTDDPEAKLLLSDAAVRTGVPLIYGGALRWEGQIMSVIPGGPCLRCLFEEPAAGGPTCAQAGVMGTAVGVVGAKQAEWGLAALAGRPVKDRLWRFDGRTLTEREIAVHRAADCRVHA